MQNKLFFGRSIKHLLVASFFATLSTAYAAFPFYEPFADATASGGTSYTVGNVLRGNINATGDVWFGTGVTTAGNKAVVNSVNLSYTGLASSSGNALQTMPGSGEGARMFASPQTSGPVTGITNQNVTVYYSLLIQLADITALSTTGDYWIGFNNQGTIADQNNQPTSQCARLYFKKVDASDFYVGIAKNSTNVTWDTTLHTISETLFIVAGYQMNAAGGVGTDDNVYLWINPDAATFGQTTPPSPTLQVIGTDSDFSFISSFVILDRTATCATSAIVDEVRVGKSWMFVTGGPEFVTTAPATINAASDATVYLSATAKSGSGTTLSYQWQKNGGNLSDSGTISGSATPNLTISSATVSDSGTYALIVTDAVGSITSSTTVTVSRPGSIFWRGGDVAAPSQWNHFATNWFNPTTSSSDFFHDGDSVVFDDTASVNSVSVSGTNMFAIMTMSNNVLPFRFTSSTGVLSGPLDLEGTNIVTLGFSNAPQFTAITNNSGSLVFALGGDTNMITAPISDNGSGQGTIVQSSPNTLVLSANNSSFNGHLIVQSGTLKAGSALSLGSSAGGIVVSNGATLDIGGFNLSNNPVVVQGAGVGGTNGAVNDSGGGAQQALAMVELAGDTTFNAPGSRWDIGTNATSGYIHGNGYTLTKIGAQTVILKDVGETGLGDIHIVQGRLGFQGNVTMGDPNKTLTAEAGTVLTIYANPNNLTKNVVLNGATIDSGGAANNLYGPVTLTGDCTIGLRYALDIWNNVSGTGSMIATVSDSVGNGAAGTTVRLHGINTFTGATVVRTKTAMVLDSQSAPASSLIEVDGTGSLDASAISTWTLANGQTIAGTGTLTASSVTFSSGSTLAPGSSNAIGTLTFNASPTFAAGSTSFFKLDPTTSSSDLVSGLSTVTFGGTLVLSNMTATPFASGTTFTLFSAGGYQGAFNSIVPATPGNGLSWDTNNLAVNGTIAIVAQPHFTGGPSKLPDGNVQLTFSGPVGQSYQLLATTNIALPLANWTVVDSGTVQSDPFTVSDLNATNYSKRFYSLGFGQ